MNSITPANPVAATGTGADTLPNIQAANGASAHTSVSQQSSLHFQQSFDAALRRASRRGAGDDDTREGEEDTVATLAAPGLLLPCSSAGTLAAAENLGAAATSHTHSPPAGTLPDAAPMSAHHRRSPIGIERQWRVSVPLDAQAKATLGMRLVNTGSGHWQMRLTTDNQTRQQLTPHLDRLRDKLHQHSKGQLSDLDFDEGGGV